MLSVPLYIVLTHTVLYCADIWTKVMNMYSTNKKNNMFKNIYLK